MVETVGGFAVDWLSGQAILVTDGLAEAVGPEVC